MMAYLVLPLAIIFIVLYCIAFGAFLIVEVFSYPLVALVSSVCGYRYMPVIAMSMDEDVYGRMTYRKHFEKRANNE